MAQAKSYVAEFQISLFPINLIGKLLTVRRTGSATESALISVCPQCETPNPPKQSYNCSEGHGPYSLSELDKAKKVDGVLVRVDKEAAEEAKTSTLLLNYLDVTVHPKDDILASTYPSANAYIFVPKVANEQYGVLVSVVESSPYAFIGQVNIKHHECLVQLKVWNGHLILQQLLYPEDVTEVEQTPVKTNQEFLTTLKKFVKSNAKEFEPTDYKNETKVRMAALVEAAKTGAEIPAVPTKKTDDQVALEHLKELLAKGA